MWWDLGLQSAFVRIEGATRRNPAHRFVEPKDLPQHRERAAELCGSQLRRQFFGNRMRPLAGCSLPGHLLLQGRQSARPAVPEFSSQFDDIDAARFRQSVGHPTQYGVAEGGMPAGRGGFACVRHRRSLTPPRKRARGLQGNKSALFIVQLTMITLTDAPPIDPPLIDADIPAAPLHLSDAAQDLLFRGAATANNFADTPISDAQMRAVFDLVKWAPTAMNSQPLRVVLVRTPEALADLLDLMAEGNRAKTEAAPLVAILAADHDFHEELPRVFPVFPGAREAFSDDGQRAQAAGFNAALQAGYFLVGIRAAGLAAGPMAGFDVDAISRRFFPDGRHQAMLVVNIGQPTDTSYRPRLPRLDYDEVVTAA